jgi:hypothetical protein
MYENTGRWLARWTITRAANTRSLVDDHRLPAVMHESLVVSAATLYRAEREICTVDRTDRRSVLAFDERVLWPRP